MRCKVRYVTELPNGTRAQKEQEVSVEGRRLRLGRGTDNDVPLKDLAVGYRHADIVLRDAGVVLVEGVDGGALRVDGVPASRGVLAADTAIGIGPYQLTLLPAEPGFDLALAVTTTAPVAAGADAAAGVLPKTMRLGGGPLGKRAWSWLLFLLILAGGLVLPVLAHREFGPGQPATPAGDVETLKATLAGLDGVWDSGELSDPHKPLAERCEACHVKAFERVADATCGGCHGATRHHFDTAKLDLVKLSENGHEAARCTACHAEHQGPDGVVPRQQSLCTGCHEGLKDLAKDTTLLNVSDFSADHHPEFRPTVVVDAAAGRVDDQREIDAGKPLVEDSGLHFDHVCHLGLYDKVPGPSSTDEERRCYSNDGRLPARGYPRLGLRDAGEPDADGTVRYPGVMEARFATVEGKLRAKLSCASCHVAEAGGGVMKPVDMEQHCSYCHNLSYAQDAELPHGRPDEVIAQLTYFEGARAAQPPAVRTDRTGKRRRPGAPPEVPVAQVAAPAAGGPSAALAQRLDTVFQNNGAWCGKCHDTISRPIGEGRKEYGVQPVQVQHVWEPKARFSHAAHENEACGRCHAAEKSSSSGVVMLPEIEVCQGCHQGEAVHAAVPSTCTMCHVYHQEEGTCPMVPAAGTPVATACRAGQPAAASAAAAN